MPKVKRPKKEPLKTKCCVQGCSTRVCSGVTMHGFPRQDRYPDLYDHWLDAIRLANSAPNWKPLKSNKVCAFHFETIEGDSGFEVRLRVPTLFPSCESDGQPSTNDPEDEYDDEEDDDPTEHSGAGDLYEDDPLDSYEDSLAVENIIAQLPYDETEVEKANVLEEDPTSTCEEIEEQYNNIVGDVVSSLETYERVMEDGSSIGLDQVEDQETATLYAGIPDDSVAEQHSNHSNGSVQSNDVEEEIVYDDFQPYIVNSGTLSEPIAPSADAADQDGLEDSDYCLVVVRHESSRSESPNERTPPQTQHLPQKKSEVSTTKKTCNKKLSMKSHSSKSKKSVKKRLAKPISGTVSTPKPNLKTLESIEKLPLIKAQVKDSDQEITDHLDNGLSRSISSMGGSFIETDEAPEEVKAVQNQEMSPSKRQAKQSLQNSAGMLEGSVKVDDLNIDGEPLTLKECSVNLVRSPSKPKAKKKSPILPKTTKSTKRDTAVKGSVDKANSGSKGPLDVLGALSLKSTQEEENTGLRRSARIKAGAGKKRTARSRWSVAFKEAPKKKRKAESEISSISSESAPYDFENDDDPDVEPDDLNDESSDSSAIDDETTNDDTDGYETYYCRSKRKSDGYEGSSKSQTKTKVATTTSKNVVKPQAYPRLVNGSTARSYKGMHHGYHRVRVGDQATQAGLPGSCDGFVFDVVRDDPRNVGVSCNIFYHYQPKRWPYRSAPNIVASKNSTGTVDKTIPIDDRCDPKSSKPRKNDTSPPKSTTALNVPGPSEPSEDVVNNKGNSGDVILNRPLPNDAEKSSPFEEAHIVGDIKVEPQIKPTSNLDSVGLNDTVEDPNDLSEFIRINEEDASSYKNLDERVQSCDGKDESLTLPCLDSDTCALSSPRIPPGDNIIEEPVGKTCNLSETKPVPDCKQGLELVVTDNSLSHERVIPATDASSPGSEAKLMNTCEADPQRVQLGNSEGFGNIPDRPNSKRIDWANIGNDLPGTDDVGLLEKSQHVGTDLLGHQVQLNERESPTQDVEMIEESDSRSPTTLSLVDGALKDTQNVMNPSCITQLPAALEHCSGSDLVSSNSNQAPMDDDAQSSCDAAGEAAQSVKVHNDEGVHKTKDELVDLDDLPYIQDGGAEDSTMAAADGVRQSNDDASNDLVSVDSNSCNKEKVHENNTVIPPAEVESGKDADNTLHVPMDLEVIQIESGCSNDEPIPPAEVESGKKAADNTLHAPMDLEFTQIESGCSTDEPIPTAEVESGKKDADNNLHAPLDLEFIQIESGCSTDEPIPPAGIPDSETYDDNALETIDLSDDPVRSSDPINSVEPNMSVDLTDDGSPSQTDKTKDSVASCSEDSVVLLSDGDDAEERVVISSDDETTPSASRYPTQNRSRGVPVNQALDTGNEITSDTPNPQLLHTGSQEVFDNVERNLEKMFDMDL